MGLVSEVGGVKVERLPVNSDRVNAIAQRLLALVTGREPQVESEVALVLAYCMIAPGVQRYPEASRADRGRLVVDRGCAALCQIIQEVAVLSDADVALALAPLGRPS